MRSLGASTRPRTLTSAGRGGRSGSPGRRGRSEDQPPRSFSGILTLRGGVGIPPPYRLALVAGLYHEGNRRLQDAFDTRRLADRLEEVKVRATIGDGDRAFIESLDMFFLATADADGRPSCSYKGGDPGFVRVLDERTLAFPNYDGNGMYLSLGNTLVNPEVGLLFVAFERGRRLRLHGTASIDPRDELLGEWPGAQCVVRVRAREVFPNCPRYIHRLALVERSKYVPRPERRGPLPRRKRRGSGGGGPPPPPLERARRGRPPPPRGAPPRGSRTRAPRGRRATPLRSRPYAR